MMHFVLVSLWAACIAVAAAVLCFVRTTTTSKAPDDIVRLAPNARVWTKLNHADDQQSLVDAVVLKDGRLAVSSVFTMDGLDARPCEILDPKTLRWSNGYEVVSKRRDAPPTNLDGVAVWANVGDGTLIAFDKKTSVDTKGGCAARLEPGAVALPELPTCPDRVAAARLGDGALLLVAAFGEERATFRLDRGGAAFTKLAPPPIPIGLDALHPFGPAGAVLEGADDYVVLRNGAWSTLPPLDPPRYAATLVLLPDDSVVAAGGFLRNDRTIVKPAMLVANVLALLATIALAGIAWKVMRSASRPHLAAIIAGLVVGWVALPAFAAVVLKKLAWH